LRDKLIEIGRDSIWYFIASAVGSALGFISIPIFTRLFIPAEYGIYSLISTVVMIGSPFIFVWLSASALRFYPEYSGEGKLDEYYSSIYHYMPHFLLLFLGICIPVAALFLPLGKYRLAVCLGIAIFAINTLYMVMLSMVRARQQAWHYCLAYVLVPFGRYVIGAGLVYAFKTHRVDSALFAWLGILIICVPLELAFLTARQYFHWKKVSRSALRTWFGFGFVLTFSNLFNHFLISGDRFILQALKGSAAVGLYSVAYNIVFSVGSLFSDFILMASVPVLNKVYVAEGGDAARALINRLTKYLLFVLTPSMVALCVLNYRIFSVFTSPKYLPARSTVLPVAIGTFLAFLSALPLQAFYLKKKTKMAVLPFGISAAVNIGVNFLLIPKYGYNGAAWATAISYLCYLVLTVALGHRYLSWDFPWVAGAKILLANIVLCGTLLAMRLIPLGGFLGLLIIILVGTMVYLIVFWLVRGFSKDEIQFGLELIKRTLVALHLMKGSAGSGGADGHGEGR
jgi:O-antigen/teichoic acid export membrane protein